ncbi:MAG TPA: carbamoyl-phosphate synthase large subunit [Treponemataceae bacterium]|nr:carbamoyl-phosphate synthase large subunit [Treponemataceae bacterium]
MPKRENIKKVLVIGSGPIIIGQAAEFDYAGTQACRTLKQEGLEVVLINSNPATIMTDRDIADKVYIEPLTVDTVKRIIEIEKPDSILPTLGGQTGLNLAMELADSGWLEKRNVTLLGTNSETIKKAEDRQAFKDTMESIGEPCIVSKVVTTYEDARDFAREIGFPVIVRPAYTLGGTGGGIAMNEGELEEIAPNGLALSRVGQVLIEKCISGWKEIEYEVIRDSAGNCIIVCNMENFDPVGVHTGDSIVVAPSQTLSDKDHQMLRSSALNIIGALGIEGGCNVQYALHPDSSKYAVIEVNPRVSRSSALASKATGYPIAKVAARIALGYTLDEIKNSVTGKTYAAFEPALDYCVVKIPRWPFDKFVNAKRKLGTQMQATGEVMAISYSFEGALMKAVRSLEQNVNSLWHRKFAARDTDELMKNITEKVSDERLFEISELMRRGTSAKVIHDITKIDYWFLDRISHILDIEKRISFGAKDYDTLMEAKVCGFPDREIARLLNVDEREIKYLRKRLGIEPAYNMVDTCAGEFEAITPYFYSNWNATNEAVDDEFAHHVSAGTTVSAAAKSSLAAKSKGKVLVLGSGPIRIGQGIEFDYCSVHSVWALKKLGYETIIVNNNPETVSTDFDIADRLYFEPLTPEDVESIVENEKPIGCVVQFGGQTAIKLANSVAAMGVPILGTSAKGVDRAEDRELFDEVLEKTKIPRAAGATVLTVDEAIKAANKLGYPVLVRPSYVLGGQGMDIAYSDGDVHEFMEVINQIQQDHPILVDKYIEGTETEVDAVCDGTDILIPGIMEHVERTGIHSGDSISVYPAPNLTATQKKRIADYSTLLAKELQVIGLINIQFIAKGEDIYVIEVNPRSSRTVPYISKVTGVPIVDIATRCMFGEKLKDIGYGTGLYKESPYSAVKMPVFSFEKLYGVETALGPEMKSTGEALGIARNWADALYKGFRGSGIKIRVNEKGKGKIAISLRERDYPEALPIVKRYAAAGFDIVATEGTCDYLNANGVAATRINRPSEPSPNIIDALQKGELTLIVNTPTRGRDKNRDGFRIRRAAVEHNCACLTAIDTANAFAGCLERGVNQVLEPLDIVEIFK